MNIYILRPILILFFLVFIININLGDTTGTLLLKGNVPTILNLIITPTNNLNLDLSTTQTDLKVADVRIISNSPTGYKVLLSSSNSGNLSKNNINIPYTAKFNNSSILLSSNNQVIYTNTQSLTNNLYNFTISYQAQNLGQLEAGDYTDTLTFTLQAN